MNQPQVGRLIRELRQELRLTQEQFAAVLGVVFPTVNRWENGHSQPSPLALKQVEGMLLDLGERGQKIKERHFSEE